MKKTLMLLVFVCTTLFVMAGEITRVEPAFWWTGMKNTELQIMVYGKDIAKSNATLNYPGVMLKETVKVENPNYLFIYIDISAAVKPGTMNIEFTDGKRKINHPYTLKARENAGGAAGFNSSDALYLIMPDRFANGDYSNDDLFAEVKSNRKDPKGRHGGDLAGIEQKLDYINDLGFTTIWLNPVQENRMSFGSYSGYAITDFYKIDARLGSNEEFRSLIDKAHSKGLKVVMDMIFNHCGDEHWWMKDLPTKDWINFPDSFVQTNHNKWTLMDIHAAESEKTVLSDGWFVKSKPDLNQRNRHLARYLVQNSIWWIEYSRIDGIRQDTHPYADFDFMAEWCRQLEAEYPEFNIVGEAWYGKEVPSAWWQQNTGINAKNTYLETVMDFALTFIMHDVFDTDPDKNGSGDLNKIYESLAHDFLLSDPDKILIFLDNHDIDRFAKKGQKDLKRYKQAIAFLLTTRGIPQLYYGTEILMSGSRNKDDGHIRADFPGGWKSDSLNAFVSSDRNPLQNEAWNYMQQLLQWRKTSSAVTQGKLIHYTPDNGVYVYARYKDDKTVLVVLNGANAEKNIQMKRFHEVTGNHTSGKDVITGNRIDIQASLSIPARGVYILELDK